MKKIILVFTALLMTINTCFAEQQLVLTDAVKYQKKIMETGFRILNSNQIEKRMTFFYSGEKTVNAGAYSSSKMIVVYKGLLPFFDDDNELAAILSHEIAHGMDFHKGLGRRWGMMFNPVKYEEKADKKAVDLMVNAGYNPVAIIVVLNKITDEPCWFERSKTHPVGSERLAYVYEYIYAKYPAYIADNDYKSNLYYQNFLLTSKEFRNTLKKKYEEKALTPVSNKTKK
jgi:predicted Zn-dependent protease